MNMTSCTLKANPGEKEMDALPERDAVFPKPQRSRGKGALRILMIGPGLAALAFLLSLMTPPRFPTPVGVVRCVERQPYEEILHEQIRAAKQRQGEGDLNALFSRGDTWTVS